MRGVGDVGRRPAADSEMRQQDRGETTNADTGDQHTRQQGGVAAGRIGQGGQVHSTPGPPSPFEARSLSFPFKPRKKLSERGLSTRMSYFAHAFAGVMAHHRLMLS